MRSLSDLDARMQRVLAQLRGVLQDSYGSRLRGLYLYGSYARGDQRDGESDVDVAVILDDFAHPWPETEHIVEATEDLCLRENVLLSCKPLRLREYEAGLWALHRSIRRDGIPI